MNLNELRTQADADHPPIAVGLSDGTTATITPLLRLPQNTRDTVQVKLNDLDRQDQAVTAQANRAAHIAVDIIGTVATDNGEQLVAEINGDLALAMAVLGQWRSGNGNSQTQDTD